MRSVLSYGLCMLPAMLTVLPFWILVRAVFLILIKRRPEMKREVLLLLLVLWCAGLASQTVFPSNGYLVPLSSVFSVRTLGRINLIPFRTIAAYFGLLRDGCTTVFLINFLGNILVFVPLGLLFPLLWQRCRGIRGILLPMLCSVAVETAQIFTGRNVDIDDVLLNTLGGLLGYLCVAAILSWRNRHERV